MSDDENKEIPETSSEVSEVAEDSVESQEIDKILEELPPQAKKVIEKRIVEFGMMSVGSRSQENAISKKINEAHISSYLDGAREQMQNSYKERHEQKIFTLVLVIIALVFFIAVIFLLQNHMEVLEKIIYTVSGLIAGAFGGYGFGRHKNSNDD